MVHDTTTHIEHLSLVILQPGTNLSKTVEQMDRQTDGLENNTFKFC